MARDELRKEMADIFRARARRIRTMPYFPTNEQVADAWDASADELDPPAKAPPAERRFEPGQLFRSTSGNTFRLIRDAWHKEWRFLWFGGGNDWWLEAVRFTPVTNGCFKSVTAKELGIEDWTPIEEE